MTHLHLSTLGQCLISLARQGIKEHLYRVLRFVESGAVVPNFQKSTPQSPNPISSSSKKKQNSKDSSNSCPILADQIKVSFEKSSSILDQINQIQQKPDVEVKKDHLMPSCNIFLPNYSTEEQCNDIQQIVDTNSPIEAYLKAQLSQLTEHLELIKSHEVNEEYLKQVQDEVQFLDLTQQLCQADYQSLQLQGQLDEFMRLQHDISSNVTGLSNPTNVLQIMKEFNLSFFESDRCFQLHNEDLSLSIAFLKRLFYTPPKSFFKIDEMD